MNLEPLKDGVFQGQRPSLGPRRFASQERRWMTGEQLNSGQIIRILTVGGRTSEAISKVGISVQQLALKVTYGSIRLHRCYCRDQLWYPQPERVQRQRQEQ